MLQLTKRTEYGLIALTHLADPSRAGDVVSVREIAERYSMPRRLLAEVLKDLGRSGHVDSQRGANGGYALSRPANEITLGEVVATLEGMPSIASCESLEFLRSASTCEVEPRCPIKSPIQRIRSGLWSLLERTTLRDLADPNHVLSPTETLTSTT